MFLYVEINPVKVLFLGNIDSEAATKAVMHVLEGFTRRMCLDFILVR